MLFEDFHIFGNFGYAQLSVSPLLLLDLADRLKLEREEEGGSFLVLTNEVYFAIKLVLDQFADD